MTAAPPADTRIALVLGADGRIGNAICHALGEEGLAVVPCARDTEALARLRSELVDAALDCPRTIAVDATDDAALASAIAEAASLGQLVVAVNNVGRGHQPVPLADMPIDEFDSIVSVTFRSVAVAMREEVRAMRATSAGDPMRPSGT